MSVGTSEVSDGGVAELTAHYRETSELNQRLWEQRNRTFLLLILTIGIGATILFKLPPPPEGGRPIIFEAVVRLALENQDNTGVVLLFPYPILHAVVLIAVFYQMVVFFHRSATVLRNYSYLARLEKEIRLRLNLPESSVAFTRESTFYWNHRPRMFGLVKYMYVGILGTLLVLFFSYRFFEDVGQWMSSPFHYTEPMLVGIDALVAIPTLVIFGAYVLNTLDLEKRLEPEMQAAAEGALASRPRTMPT
jgi:hypothetical protein